MKTAPINVSQFVSTKIDVRKSYRICLDTETFNYEDGAKFGTCPRVADPWRKMCVGVGPTHPVVFNVGFAVFDKDGNVYERYSFLISDTGAFRGTEIYREVLLAGGFFTDEKIRKIQEGWNARQFGVVTWDRFLRILNGIAKVYNVKYLYAHNASFDYRALSNTHYVMGHDDTDSWLDPSITIVDTLKMSKVVTERRSYRRWCEENNTWTTRVVDGVEKRCGTYLTAHKTPRPRATAEVLYRHLTREMNFIEDHTALKDVEIELELACWFIRQHKKMGDCTIPRLSRGCCLDFQNFSMAELLADLAAIQ